MWRIYPGESLLDLSTTWFLDRQRTEFLVHHDLTTPRLPPIMSSIGLNVVRASISFASSPPALLPYDPDAMFFTDVDSDRYGSSFDRHRAPWEHPTHAPFPVPISVW